ncbi:MAG: zinc ribbon domain-containing protein [Anaerolineae bacterium]|nr:zinc ribbon domain-containing protein [Anaerolineae bacterium]
MRCEACSKVVPDDVAYCAYCGAKAAASGMHAPIFRFADSEDQAATLKDLAYLIDRNWEASLRHLYEGDFANWLGSLGRGVLADQARDIVKAYPADRALGLELFVNVISDAARADVPHASPELTPRRIDFGAVPRDATAETRLVITNKHARGHLTGRLRTPPGVFWLTFTPRDFAGPRTEVTLTANTRDMPAGARHRTRLMVTTPFETVETDVTLRISTEWAAILRAMVAWALAGAVGLFAASVAALLLPDLLPNAPWPLVYVILAFIVALISFGSIKTRDVAAAIVLSALIGVVTLIPIALGAMALGFVLRLLNYQTTTIASAIEAAGAASAGPAPTGVALAIMAAAGAVLGLVAGLFAGLRRVGRAPTAVILVTVLLAGLVTGLYAFRPAFVLGEFRPNQPLLTSLRIPVPYLAFAPTPPAPGGFGGDQAALTPTVPARPTVAPSPTPGVRPVANVTLLWDVVLVEEGVSAGAVSGAVDAEGRAVVAYTVAVDAGVELRYAMQQDEGWAIDTVDSGDLAGAALALDAAGRPYIAYTANASADPRWRCAWLPSTPRPTSGRWRTPTDRARGAGPPS